jgi:hypothetical protein
LLFRLFVRPVRKCLEKVTAPEYGGGVWMQHRRRRQKEQVIIFLTLFVCW